MSFAESSVLASILGRAALLLLAAAPICHPALLPALQLDTASVPDTSQLRADIRYLASDSLEGRPTGSAGNARAAVFIINRYRAIPLQGPFPVTGCASPSGCTTPYLQYFALPPQLPAGIHLTVAMAENIGALLIGTDTLLRNEVVVVGAHYDHIGHWSSLATDPQAGAVLHPGAMRTPPVLAGVLMLAERLSRHPPRRSILFINFGAEELGLFGSRAFVQNSPVSLDSITARLNLDMIGRLRKKLEVESPDFDKALGKVVDAAIQASGLSVQVMHRDTWDSDYSPFSIAGIPSLEFFTGFHEDYHGSHDTADRINVEGMVRVLDLVERIVLDLANRDAKLRRLWRK